MWHFVHWPHCLILVSSDQNTFFQSVLVKQTVRLIAFFQQWLSSCHFSMKFVECTANTRPVLLFSISDDGLNSVRKDVQSLGFCFLT